MRRRVAPTLEQPAVVPPTLLLVGKRMMPHAMADSGPSTPRSSEALCAAAAASDGAQQPGSTSTAADGSVSSGRLERHVVAKSDARKAVGPAGYRIAQKAGWGDLWPAPYMQHTRREVLAEAGAPAEADEGAGRQRRK